jgi:CRISPR/Cas system-associated exonuclease Cas4 (RecB family)
LHALALGTFLDASNAAFVLVVSAFLWTGLASWRLQVLLLAHQKSEVARVKAGLDTKTEVLYSDDDQGNGLLTDPLTGLRGRPDQIVIVDGDFIPVEQKTGKIPATPHDSHRMQLLAYLHLVECETGRASPYGVIRYGQEHVFQIMWDDLSRSDLNEAVTELQRLMVEGGATRNHQRVGKCRNCSRRHACPERLDASA